MRKMKKNQENTTRKKIHRDCIINRKTPFSVLEAYKNIRTNLIFSIPEKGCKKILITSTMMHEFKSTTAINLCYTLAHSGFKVLMIDCDLRLTEIASYLRLKRSPGLSEYLVNMADLESVIQNNIENMDVIAGGTIPPNPSELLGSEEMEKLIKRLETMYDYIVIDSPPVGSVTDPVILGKLVDGHIFVVRNNVARKDVLDNCLKQMSISGSRMLGFIYTGSERARSSYYYNYYYKDDKKE